MFGKLYIVATPIGNLNDFSKRGIDTLKSVNTILTEDTRVTRKLLSRFEIKTNIESYHQHSDETKKLKILKLLIDGKDVALVSDAGTPGISDPGNELIDYLLDKEPNLKIIPIPGPSAITTALSICGFNVKEFTFLGFFPKRKRTKSFLKIKKGKQAYIFFESPKRLLKTITELQKYIGSNRRIFIGRELTKLHEKIYRGTINAVLSEVSREEIKGEIIVIIEKKKPPEAGEPQKVF